VEQRRIGNRPIFKKNYGNEILPGDRKTERISRGRRQVRKVRKNSMRRGYCKKIITNKIKTLALMAKHK